MKLSPVLFLRKLLGAYGQQFWVMRQLGICRRDGPECEAILWDFFGQPDYRPPSKWG